MKYALGDRRITCKGDYWIAENAIVIGAVVLDHNASVWFNCVVRGDNDVITIGENSQLQDGCIVHVDEGHPLTLGKNVSVGHMAMLHGCTIGDGSLIGIQAIVLNNATIGRDCLVAAGALVLEGKVFADRSLIVGAPARVARQLTDADLVSLRRAAEVYVERGKAFKAGLVRIS